MKNAKERKQYMKWEHLAPMEGLTRSHRNCIAATGVARPGKTAQDKV